MKNITEEFISTKEALENSEAYTKFTAEHSGYYIVNAFTQLDTQKNAVKPWQFSYYSEKEDHLAVFETKPSFTFNSFQEALKKEGAIPELKDMPSLSIDDVFEKLKSVLEEKHPHHIPKNYLVIVQANGDGVSIYNVTIVTINFTMLTFHINATSGEVIHENVQSVMDLGEQIKGDAQ